MDAGSTLSLHTGRAMPVLGLGTWELTRDTAGTVEEALRRGYRMIDTADDYGSQPGIGEALHRTEVDRRAIYLVAKVEEDEDAYDSTRRSLGEMDQDYADLVLIHRPPPSGVGQELWHGLVRARGDGLCKDIGVSNYSVEQLEELTSEAGEAPAVNQVEWTPFGWSREMLDYCREHRILIQAYSPLTRAERLDDERLGRLARTYGRTPAQILLRWNLQLGVVPLPKANRQEHLIENLGVFDFEISDEDMKALGDLNEPWSSLGPKPQYL
ncbi:MAG: aldo/keto reductase [Gemmatimonadota bacterium]